MTNKEYQILRDLAKQVAEIAVLPIQQETISLWKALNGLKPVRPMVMIANVPWHEMNVDGELSMQTEDLYCRLFEIQLRRILYAWKHMRADIVVEPVIEVPMVIMPHDLYYLGLLPAESIVTTDPENDVVSHSYSDQLKTEDDLEKIKCPEITLHEEFTKLSQERALEIFGGILNVQMRGWVPEFQPWDTIVEWRGAESVLYDLADRPKFMHMLMARTTEAYLSMLDQLESKGLLSSDLNTVHCTGAYTDELLAPSSLPLPHKAKDLWTAGMAQIFGGVSPAMHKEFELDYAVRWYERFGLVYYGCCEPLHGKIDIIRTIPHLRKISMSPWVDVEKGAERIGGDFVFSRKPNPAFLAGERWDVETMEQDMRDTMERCARHGCPVEFILKDISTVRYQPQRLWEWADIAMRLAHA